MKEVKYNPFGSTENQYSYNAIVKREEKKTPWGIIAIAFVATCLVVSYIVAYLSAEQVQNEADESINNFNDAISSVHDTFSDPILPQELRDAADEREEKIGGEDESVKATRILANVIGHFEEGAPEFDKHGTREGEAIKIAPYYAACDISMYSLDVSAVDYKGMCDGFTTVAYNMMTSVRKYNHVSNGLLGKITFHTDEYVDVMNKPGEIVPEMPGTEDVPAESGELPPEDKK